MNFRQLPSIFPGQLMWGAAKDGYTFIITKEERGFCVSCKTPLGGKRIDIHGYDHPVATLEEAKRACEDELLRKTSRLQ